MHKHKIARLHKQKEILESKYNSNETMLYNFYGGFDLGYIVGQLSVLEDMQDEIDEQSVREHNDRVKRDFFKDYI
jgi:hypothetical protein